MQTIHDIIYPLKTYPELKMKLELLGLDTFPRRYVVEFAMSDPDLWKRFAEAVEWRLRNGTSLEHMNLLNVGFI